MFGIQITMFWKSQKRQDQNSQTCVNSSWICISSNSGPKLWPWTKTTPIRTKVPCPDFTVILNSTGKLTYEVRGLMPSSSYRLQEIMENFAAAVWMCSTQWLQQLSKVIRITPTSPGIPTMLVSFLEARSLIGTTCHIEQGEFLKY